jgi:hypothetical protein
LRVACTQPGAMPLKGSSRSQVPSRTVARRAPPARWVAVVLIQAGAECDPLERRRSWERAPEGLRCDPSRADGRRPVLNLRDGRRLARRPEDWQGAANASCELVETSARAEIPSRCNLAAAPLAHGDHGGTWRHVQTEVGPARRRILERRLAPEGLPFLCSICARMLNGDEKGLAVGG